MSRSYKKTPYSGDTKHKEDKRAANRRVRRYLNRLNLDDESFAPAAYKKVSESWNICDYYSITTFADHLYSRKKHYSWGIKLLGAKFDEDGNLDEKREYRLWWKWYKAK